MVVKELKDEDFINYNEAGAPEQTKEFIACLQMDKESFINIIKIEGVSI